MLRLSVAPGDPGYTGAWTLARVVEAVPGRVDLATHRFTSPAQVQNATAGALVDVSSTLAPAPMTMARPMLLHADPEPQSPHEWEQWLTVAAGTPDERVATRLIHAHCHRRTIGHGNHPALLPTRESSGLA
jgi:hypothetical protein